MKAEGLLPYGFRLPFTHRCLPKLLPVSGLPHLLCSEDHGLVKASTSSNTPPSPTLLPLPCNHTGSAIRTMGWSKS